MGSGQIFAAITCWKWWITWITHILLLLMLYFTLNGSLAYSFAKQTFNFETRKPHISTANWTKNSKPLRISFKFQGKYWIPEPMIAFHFLKKTTVRLSAGNVHSPLNFIRTHSLSYILSRKFVVLWHWEMVSSIWFINLEWLQIQFESVTPFNDLLFIITATFYSKLNCIQLLLAVMVMVMTTVLLQCNNQRINMEKAIRSNNNFNI